jgi:putative tryptophan/tyrosine transport system substrate-binding protein
MFSGLRQIGRNLRAFPRVQMRDVRSLPPVPAVYPNRFFAVDGGLISYGIDNIDMYRQAAAYVDRILKGSKVAELPGDQS